MVPFHNFTLILLPIPPNLLVINWALLVPPMKSFLSIKVDIMFSCVMTTYIWKVEVVLGCVLNWMKERLFPNPVI